MAKLLNLPAQAIIDGFKGKVDYYVHAGIPCARRWPRSPSAPRAQAVQATWQVFTDASRLWSQLSPEIQAAYVDMAVGSDLTGKDLFTRGYISGLVAPGD